MSLANVLDRERKRLDMTVYRLAKLSGMSAGRMHAILDGTTANPGLFTVIDVLTAMDRDLAWLNDQRGAFTPSPTAAPAKAAK